MHTIYFLLSFYPWKCLQLDICIDDEVFKSHWTFLSYFQVGASHTTLPGPKIGLVKENMIEKNDSNQIQKQEHQNLEQIKYIKMQIELVPEHARKKK